MAAIALSTGQDDGDLSDAIQLLGDIRDAFEAVPHMDRMFSRDVCAALVQRVDRPWPEWRRGRPLTETQMAALLKPFDVRPRKVRIGDTVLQGYSRVDFDDAFARYLPAKPEHPEQRSPGAQDG
jgi:hypothetical protein